jgi:hypothetical protein
MGECKRVLSSFKVREEVGQLEIAQVLSCDKN